MSTAPVPGLSPQALHRFAEMDHDMHRCWVVFGNRAPVHNGPNVRSADDAAAADVALDAANDPQRTRPGELRVAAMVAAACDVGVRSLVWLADAVNVPVSQAADGARGRTQPTPGLTTAQPSI